jgi:hypothetical protein
MFLNIDRARVGPDPDRPLNVRARAGSCSRAGPGLAKSVEGRPGPTRGQSMHCAHLLLHCARLLLHFACLLLPCTPSSMLHCACLLLLHARLSVLVLCRLRLKALSRPNRAEGSRGRHKPSLRPVTAHGSGFISQKPEAAAQADGFAF